MRILVLPGDGIGPEITAAAMSVLRAADRAYGLGLTFECQDIGFVSLAKYGTTLRDEVLDIARSCDGTILGPQSVKDYPPVDKGGRNVSIGFRIGLDLYANVRPARSRPGLGRGTRDLDLVIMREDTEGFYSDRNMYAGSGEFMPTADVALSVRKISAFACERIARQAFELARGRRRHVTAVHKAPVLRLSDGLFLAQVQKVAKKYPEVRLDDVLVDTMAAQLVRDASRYDVIVTTNLYGDILSDLASELSGSIGLGGAIMASDSHCCAQAQHGSAPDIQGQDRANPTSMILSAAMMLVWMGEYHKVEELGQAGRAIESAVDRVLAEPGSRTADLGGSIGCLAFGERVAQAVAAG